MSTSAKPTCSHSWLRVGRYIPTNGQIIHTTLERCTLCGDVRDARVHEVKSEKELTHGQG